MATLLSVAATAYVIAVPMYASSAADLSASRLGAATSHAGMRLLEVSPGAVAVLALPVIIAAVPLAPRLGRSRATATTVSAALLVGFALLGMMSVGLFYIPAALALVVAARLPERRARAG